MKPKIGVIIASNRDARIGHAVATWFMGIAKKYTELEFQLIDLQEENLPFLNEPKLPAEGNYQQKSTIAWSNKISRLDGFVFVTPEYNHGYPASLKNAVDTLYREWQKKPVAFVGYGVLGAARSIEQMIAVVSQIGMVPLGSRAINIINSSEFIDDKGKINQDIIKGSKPEYLFSELAWWAKLLKSVRSK